MVREERGHSRNQGLPNEFEWILRVFRHVQDYHIFKERLHISRKLPVRCSYLTIHLEDPGFNIDGSIRIKEVIHRRQLDLLDLTIEFECRLCCIGIDIEVPLQSACAHHFSPGINRRHEGLGKALAVGQI